ncbi:8-oxoguanine DNA glycosylase OGG fold protein [Demequina subtropica]|uniref:8-oxoguanine DNA glycosylase OGG fold protein n=1 Tax=Demequina subtropica TaxID=1638989 RepID=UPI000781CE0C|nr:hypothetical protein [Demequina subtropica]
MTADAPAALRARLDEGTPAQPGMDYIPVRWAEWIDDLGVVTLPMDGPRASIDRAQMCAFVHEHVDARPVDAFVTVLQWGYGTGGRGPSRARKMLTGGLHDAARARAYDPTVADKLAESVAVARTGDPREAYLQLARGSGKISGFGPAFFTKWLYAVSAQGDPRAATALPILDELLQTWIARESGTELRYGDADDYARYVDILDAWAAEAGAARIDVELAIFTLERERRRAASRARRLASCAQD